MSDRSYIVVSFVILSVAKDLAKNTVFLPLQKDAHRHSDREVPHFVRDDPQLNTTQRTLREHV